MASVESRQFADLNDDRFLNPGFSVPGNLTKEQYEQIGYTNDEIELPRPQIYSNILLINLKHHCAFE